MDFNILLSQLKGNVNALTVAIFILLVASEVLGSNKNIEANSIYKVFKALLQTVKDQIWPKAIATPPAAEDKPQDSPTV